MIIGEGSAVSQSISRPEGTRRSSILMKVAGGGGRKFWVDGDARVSSAGGDVRPCVTQHKARNPAKTSLVPMRSQGGVQRRR